MYMVNAARTFKPGSDRHHGQVIFVASPATIETSLRFRGLDDRILRQTLQRNKITSLSLAR